MESRVVKFIERHHVMTLATVSQAGAYCCNLFYAYINDSNEFVFSSSSQTRHASEFVANSRVAASITLESKVVGKLQGLQIEGEVVKAESHHRDSYISKYPYAALAGDIELWVLRPSFFKLTDNRLGFGKKIIWRTEE